MKVEKPPDSPISEPPEPKEKEPKTVEERFIQLVEALLSVPPDLGILTDDPLFFDNRSFDCIPLVENCVKALTALPAVTPPPCKIQRSQYNDVKGRLEGLISDFAGLQENINTVLNPATEAVTKTGQLLIITGKIPFIIADMVFMKLECEKIKQAMDL